MTESHGILSNIYTSLCWIVILVNTDNPFSHVTCPSLREYAPSRPPMHAASRLRPHLVTIEPTLLQLRRNISLYHGVRFFLALNVLTGLSRHVVE